MIKYHELSVDEPRRSIDGGAASDRKLRITHVLRQFNLNIGGIPDAVFHLAREQVAAGHEVRVLAEHGGTRNGRSELPPLEYVRGIEVRRIDVTGLRKYRIALGIFRHLEDADIVHVHGIDSLFGYLGHMRWAHKKPLVLSTHGEIQGQALVAAARTTNGRSGDFKPVARTSLSAYGFVAASGIVEEQRLRTIRSRGLQVIEDGVEIQSFSGLGATSGERRMLCFGHASLENDIDALFAFLRELRCDESGWRLTIAGSPNGVSIAELQTKASAVGVGNQVEFVASPDTDELRGLILRCSVYVAISPVDEAATKLIEAASGGLLPIVADSPHHAATLQRLGVGVIVDFHDAATAAIRFCDAWRDWESDLEASRERAISGAEKFGWPSIARQYETIYRRVMGTTSRYVLGADTNVTRSERLVETIDTAIAEGAPIRLAFLNANLANLIAADQTLAQDLRAFMLVNDGVGVDMASRILYGSRFPENLNGTDFTPRFLSDTRHRLKLFLLGATRETLEAAVAEFKHRWPQHKIVGTHDGFFAPHQSDEIALKIKQTSPDVILVGMGNPRQEQWVARHLSDYGGAVFAVGALFDFVSGRIPRAPVWVRSLRAEWVFRLSLEPRRMWRRYLLGNMIFLSRVMAQKMRGERAH